MKRGFGENGLFLVSFSLVLILSLSLVSAGWFSDFFGKITGKSVDDVQYLQAGCTDSDGGKNLNLKGTATSSTESQTDYCSSSARLLEYWCRDGVSVEGYYADCSGGCIDGACIGETSSSDSNGTASTNVTDSSSSSSAGNETNGTITSNPGSSSDGTSSTLTNMTCTDSDGGKNYYVFGTVNATGLSAQLSADTCIDDFASVVNSGPYLNERFCNSDKWAVVQYTCPDGCLNGACANVSSVTGSSNSCASDFNADGIVNQTDYALFVDNFNLDPKNETEKYDLNNDGSINFGDYTLFAQSYGKTCSSIGELESSSGSLTKPVVPAFSSDNKSLEGNVSTACINSCSFEGECVPIGYRTGNSTYCDLGYIFTEQKMEGAQCLNSFECDSNFCSSGECVSANLIQKILNWFRNIFGDD